jgi:hypothetical protein
VRALAVIAGALLLAPPATPAPGPSALDVLAEARRLASEPLWPAFDPATAPLAIHDGERTYLAGHPSPPAGFAPVPGRGGILQAPGRPEWLVANSSAMVAGVATATVVLTTGPTTTRQWAAVAIHEAFHVFEARRGMAAANEAELFTYPLDDARPLALRRRETAALAAALAATDPDLAGAWAMTALACRRARFATLPDGARNYERALERYEGLAAYVQGKALEEDARAALPAADFPLAEVRPRAYATGRALAVLLDRLAPGWSAGYDLAAGPPLDELLLDRLLSAAVIPNDLDEELADRTWTESRREVVGHAAALQHERDAYLASPGWRLVVVAPRPLMPKGFDPMNVSNLGHGELLHTRWVRLAGDTGEVGVHGRCLTVGAGTHPLFGGIREVTVTGLAAEPVVTVAGTAVKVSGQGVTAEFTTAAVVRSDRTVTVTLR